MAVKPIGTTQLTWGSLMGRGNREPLDDTQSNYSYTDLLWELNQRTGNPSDAAYTIGANKGGSGNFYVGLITSVPYVNDDVTDTKKKIANSHYTKQSDGTLIPEDLNLKGPWYVSYCGTDTRYGNNGVGKYGFNPDGNGNTYYADRIVLRQEMNYALDKDYVRKVQLGTYYTGVGLWYDSYMDSKEYAGGKEVPDGTYFHTTSYAEIFNDYTHNVATGTFAHAEGQSTSASGQASHTEGSSTDAIGDYAHAEGEETHANAHASHSEGGGTSASGEASHAEGSGSVASGIASHAEGIQSKANAKGAHSEGNNTIVDGEYAHAEGNFTSISENGNYAHAEGTYTHSNGMASHAEGNYTYAIEEGTHTEGYQNRAYGPYSHIEGLYNTSYGTYSHSMGTYNWTYKDATYSSAEGQYNNVYANSSHTEGDYNYNYGEYSHIEGHSNVTYGNYSHVEGRTNIGYGLDSHVEGYVNVAYSDASHVQGVRNMAYGDYSNISGTLNVSYENATYSNIEGYSNVGYAGFAHIEGANNNTYGTYSHIEGNYNYVDSNGAYVHIEGTHNVSYASHTQISGYANIAGPNAKYSHIEGNENRTYSAYAHAEGYQTFVNTTGATYSHTEGYGTKTEGLCAHAEGHSTIACGIASHAEGEFTNAVGVYSHTEGRYAVTNAPYSHAEGFYTNALGTYSHVEGSYTYTLSTDDYDDSTGESAHAEGYNSMAYGTYSHAEGCDTTTYYLSSHAEGHRTIAKANYAHSEGQGSEASGVASHTEGYRTIAEANYAHAEGGDSQAYGISSHAEGQESIANGKGSHAEGYGTIAEGISSHTEGYHTNANGEASHAEGEGNNAEGDCSHAEGIGTIAKGIASHTEGYYTIVENDYENATGVYNKSEKNIYGGTIFTVGTGTSDTSRHNALAIYKDGTVNVDSNANISVNSSGYFLNTTTTDYVSYVGRDCEFLIKNNLRIAGHPISTTSLGATDRLVNTYIESMHAYIGNRDNMEISGMYSVGIGTGLKISYPSSVATSKFNKDESAYFMIGIGASDTNRKNAFWISQGNTEGTNGVAYFSNNTYVYANTYDPGQYPNNIEDKSWSAVVTYNMYRNSYTYLYKTVTDKFDTFGSNTYFVKSIDAFTYTPTSYTVHFTTQKFDNASNSWPTTTYQYDIPQAIPGALENDNTGMAGLMSARDKARLDSIWEGDKPISTISISNGTWTIYKNDGTTTYNDGTIKYISKSATNLQVEYGFKPQWTGTWKWDNNSNAKKSAERCTGTWGTTLPANNINSSSWSSSILTSTGTVCSETIYAAKRGLTILNYSGASSHLGAIVPASGEDSAFCSVSWSTYRLLFYGKTTQAVADAMDMSIISGLSNAKITGRSWTINYVADGSTCFVMAYPAEWQPINTIKKNGVEIITSSFLQVGQVDYTNGAGLTQKYYIYRSGVGTASMSITIN